ncbi:MAG: cell filamentation protein Fic, partial [Candidatus Omnitrophica bacterium]|nr:cell filamentation protein Fic [Candidatus Omnitrophota bacterium]
MGIEKIAYTHLISRFGLDVTEPPIASFLLDRGSRRTQIVGGRREEYYPPRDNPGPHWIDHLKFALKHEGVNLEVLSALFQAAPTRDLTAWIKKSPTSRYTRTAWFLYEWLSNKELPVSDLNRGNYFTVLDPKKYYAIPREKGATAEKRYRVVNNLLGQPTYCPIVRRTEELSRFEGLRLDKRAADLIKTYPSELLYRAAQYLYAKETKSSYAIEHLTSDKRRTARFV